MQIKKPIIIEEDVMVEGRVYSPYPTQIKGYVVGEIISKGCVTIHKYGEVRGNIKTEDALIEGKFIGNLILSGNLEITATGRLIGNVITQNLDFIIESGGVFKGRRFIVEDEEIFVINKDEIIADLNIKVKETA
ncbi:MAG: bactofilin family protein [Nitrososphaeraceae archaeon]